MIALRDLLPRSPRPPCRHRHTADTAATTSTAAGSSPTPLPRLAPTSAPPTQHQQLLMVERRSPSHGERHTPACPVRQVWWPLPPPLLRRGTHGQRYGMFISAVVICFYVYLLIIFSFQNRSNIVDYCPLRPRIAPPPAAHESDTHERLNGKFFLADDVALH